MNLTSLIQVVLKLEMLLFKLKPAQAEIAIEEADVIIFMVNVREGLTQSDEMVAQMLYKSKKPVVLAVNKVDNLEMRNDIYDFYSLGFGDPYPISGSHGLGLGDLLDAVVENFNKESEDHDEDTYVFLSSVDLMLVNLAWSMLF